MSEVGRILDLSREDAEASICLLCVTCLALLASAGIFGAGAARPLMPKVAARAKHFHYVLWPFSAFLMPSQKLGT
eukprot:6462749-Amphidinium_carterae.4